VVLAVVHVELLHVVKELVRAKPAAWMLLRDMRLQRRVLIERLLKQQHWLVLNAQLAEIDFVRMHIVLAELLGLGELLCGVPLGVHA
jgi:hypothetical protein